MADTWLCSMMAPWLAHLPHRFLIRTSWLVFFICKEFLQLLWLPPVRIIGNSELSLGVNVRDRLQPPMTPTSIDGWKGYMIVDEVSYF